MPRALRLCLVLTLVLSVPVLAHLCVDVTITAAPSTASAGSQIAASGDIDNCGTDDTDYQVTWALVGNNQRIQLATKIVSVAQGNTQSITDQLFIPSTVSNGQYSLVLHAEAPTGFQDSDSSPLTIQ